MYWIIGDSSEQALRAIELPEPLDAQVSAEESLRWLLTVGSFEPQFEALPDPWHMSHR